jgi:hypothetical protein
MRKLIIFLLSVVIVISFLPADSFAAGFTREAIEFEARSLMNRMEISRDVSYKLKNRLSAALKDTTLSEVINSKGVDAVFAYACGEGGVVIKYMGGDGLISFIGGRKAAAISLKSWSIGAMIGGSAQWGIGLVIGRADENDFGGDYKGGVKAATAWESATTGMLFLRHNQGESDHDLYIISTGRGLSAGVGGIIMSITPGW